MFFLAAAPTEKSDGTKNDAARPSLVRMTNRRGTMQQFGIGLLRLPEISVCVMLMVCFFFFGVFGVCSFFQGKNNGFFNKHATQMDYLTGTDREKSTTSERFRLRPPRGAEFNDVVLHPKLRQQVGLVVVCIGLVVGVNPKIGVVLTPQIIHSWGFP